MKLTNIRPVGRYIVAWAFSPEDARRIVACVNACEGVGTKLLEDFPQGMNGMSKVIIAKQRDELLEIVSRVEGILRDEPKSHNVFLALTVVREAIAKAKAGAS